MVSPVYGYSNYGVPTVNPYNPPQYGQSFSNSNYSVAYVNNENEARNYPVGPGNTLILMDLNNSRFYMKSADFSGMPQTMRIFEYTEVIPENQNDLQQGDYISREEFEQFKHSFAPPALPMKESKEMNSSEYVSREEFEKLKQMVETMRPHKETR